jgi:hypothetical protein
MEKDWLLAFSDGVIAIIITIMVLELRPPHEPTLEALREVGPSIRPPRPRNVKACLNDCGPTTL